MTKEEQKEVIRVCGKNYRKSDIPTYIRNRDKEELKSLKKFRNIGLLSEKEFKRITGNEVMSPKDVF